MLALENWFTSSGFISLQKSMYVQEMSYQEGTPTKPVLCYQIPKLNNCNIVIYERWDFFFDKKNV